jgi:Ca2+-binding RTX toxin-like protein
MAEGQTFYVDPVNGNDNNNGLSEGSAWKSVQQVNSQTFQPGDAILFKSGEIYHEPLRVTADGTESAPITIGSYGNGPDPIFDGAVDLRSATWVETSPGSHVWTTAVAAVGGENPGRLFLNAASANLEAADIGGVTKAGDWAWSNGTLAVYSDTAPSDAFSALQLQVQNRMVDVRDSSHVVIENIDVAHARYGIVLTNTDHSTIIDCDTFSNTVNGMTIVNGSDNLIHGGSSFDNGRDGATSATRVGHGVLLDGTSNNIVEGMQLYGNAEDGVQFGPHDGDGNIIRNNEMYGNGEDGVDIKSGDQTFVDNFIHDNVENGLNLNGTGTITVVRNHIEDNGKAAVDTGAYGAVISFGNLYIGGGSTTAAVWAPNRTSSFTGDTFIDGGLSSRTSVGLANGSGHTLLDNLFVMTNPGTALRIDRQADYVTLQGNQFYSSGAYLLQFTAGKTIVSDDNVFLRADSPNNWIRIDGATTLTYGLSSLLNGVYAHAQGADQHSTFVAAPVDVQAMASGFRVAEGAAASTPTTPAIAGTASDDRLYGSASSDDISGASGNDRIDGANGNDQLRGGGGNDTISGGAGHDIIDGGDSQDTLQGNAGNDFIYAGDGDDNLFGGDGDDALFGEAGNDRFSGGAGDDVLLGGDGIDTLQGDVGDDVLIGGAGDDHLFGGDNHDNLFGDAGNDRLSGGSGDDALFGGDGDDIMQADGGHDTLDGGSGNDRLAGSTGDDVLRGGDGSDVLEGGADNDWLAGGQGSDHVVGGAGADLFVFDQAPGAVDTIGDFQHGIDQIVLDRSAFASQGEFVSGSGSDLAAVNGEATLLYDTRTGVLSFDADGVGALAAVHIATLGNRPILTMDDFLFT